ncbi:MAG: T9SS type A sorting domain-containing protein [Bacteroidota bacterium]|nr:T9SS type A sorting domain-containing protein [Bacteroidota bacterium]
MTHFASGGMDDGYAVRGMATGSDGFLYVVGSYENNYSIGGTTISTAYNSAIYLAKFGLDDLSLIWLERIAESTASFLKSSIAVDLDNNVIIAIGFEHDLFLFNDSVVIPNDQSIHLLKLDSDGEKIWAYPSNGQFLGNKGIGVDSQNNIVVIGTLSEDVFVTKYDTYGSLIWSRTGGSQSSTDEGYFVDTDSEGNVYISGRLNPNSSIYFDNYYVSMPVNAYSATFLAKYNSDGMIQWVRYVYSQTFAKFAFISRIHVLESDSVIVSGWFDESLLRFSNSFSPVGNNQSGYSAGFLAFFAPDGSRVWARKLHNNTNGYDGGVNGLTSIANNIYLTDQFEGTITFDTAAYTAAESDLLLERYDLSGNLMSSDQIGGDGFDIASDLLIAGSSIYVLGATESQPFHVGDGSFEIDHPMSMFVISLTDNFVNVRDPLGTTEHIELVPNPNNGTFSVIHPKSEGELLVKDTKGRVIATLPISPSETSRDIKLDLRSGIYILTITTENWIHSSRFVVTSP